MSDAPHAVPDAALPEPFRLPPATQRWLWAFAWLGLVAFARGLAIEPRRAWTSFLVSAFFFLTIALGAGVFLALHNVTRAGWHTVLKRVPEALAAYLPVGGLTMLAIIPAAPVLYEWSHAEHADELLHAKAPYLNLPFFAGRMVAFLLLWWLMIGALRRRSARQDADRRIEHSERSVGLSAVFLIVFAYTFSLASIDWLMSLEPHWQSTIFGLYGLSGLLVSSIAVITILVVFLGRSGHLPEVGPAHLHDLGKLLFGLSTFWAYIWVSQYLLIWYANLPEETPYFITRTQGGWGFLFWANLALGWLLPFTFLLPAPAKRSPTNLLWVSAFLLIGRWLDIHLMVVPGLEPEHPGIGLTEVGTFVGFVGLFAIVVGRALEARPLVPLGDPYLRESQHHTG